MPVDPNGLVFRKAADCARAKHGERATVSDVVEQFIDGRITWDVQIRLPDGAIHLERMRREGSNFAFDAGPPGAGSVEAAARPGADGSEEKPQQGHSNSNPAATETVKHAGAARAAMQGQRSTAKPESAIALRRLSDVQARPVRWLWQGRIARGKVSIIAGHPGLGKSQLSLRLAATVTTGGKWPVDGSRCELGSVLILSAEDDAEDTIRPRLEAAGADLTRCHILDAVEERAANGSVSRRSFSLERDLGRLSDALTALMDVALVVIDPVTAYLGGADSHKAADVRALLAPLGELAARHGVAVVAVSHLRKGGPGEALMQVSGSHAFVAAARAAYIVAKDQDDPTRRLMLPAKNNLGSDQAGYAFKVAAVRLPCGIETSRIEWEPALVMVTADEALAPPQLGEDRSAVDEAMEFLSRLLEEGPVSARQVRRDAKDAGHHWATIRRAQKALGIEAAKAGMQGGWEWRLPPKVLNKTEDAQEKSMNIFGGIEHLRAGEEVT
jgi:putative DNA primase/helicase